MIRRELQLPGEAPQWLLISQVEHARLSGVLGEHCLSHFPDAVRTELFHALVHHDDGWVTWDARPQLDPERHRPLSFFEVPHEASLPMWTDSISAAAEFGPLAGWVVASHFLALLDAGDDPLEPFEAEWRRLALGQQVKWFDAWHAQNPELHSADLAADALLWLQLLDVMSLWLCGSCPAEGETADEPATDKSARYLALGGSPLETQLSFDGERIRMQPWRFDVPALQLEVAGWLVPVREYCDAEELLAARTGHIVRWRIASD